MQISSICILRTYQEGIKKISVRIMTHWSTIIHCLTMNLWNSRHVQCLSLEGAILKKWRKYLIFLGGHWSSHLVWHWSLQSDLSERKNGSGFGSRGFCVLCCRRFLESWLQWIGSMYLWLFISLFLTMITGCLIRLRIPSSIFCRMFILCIVPSWFLYLWWQAAFYVLYFLIY